MGLDGPESKTKPVVLWLGTNTCAGDLLSFLNNNNPGYQTWVNDYVDLRYDYLLGVSQGPQNIEILDSTLADLPGRYILIVEGTIPTNSYEFCSVIGIKNSEYWTALQAVRELGAKAGHIIAAGTCAAFGGPYAAAPNPTGSVPLQAILRERTVINVPGCPINPEWLMGTINHLILYGVPELDSLNRPRLFYGQTIHDQCQRRAHFDNGVFAENPGEPWCMYKLGCKGPTTYADCPSRQWNTEHVSWPVKANTPCIGCTSPEFPDGDMPFFEHLPDVELPGIRMQANQVGRWAGLFTALGIGSHLAANIVTGRLAGNYKRDLASSRRKRLLKKKILRKKF
ncbi:MAG: hydrogenase small subunit [Peptococcaceae bacterium]|nr:hydrogenase small subunit [Peptococcaceae bacterium]